MTFNKLIRFQDPQGTVRYGEVPQGVPWDADLVGLTVQLYEGAQPWDENFRLVQNTAKVAALLSPIPFTPLVYGIGLNYRQHAEEAKVCH